MEFQVLVHGEKMNKNRRQKERDQAILQMWRKQHLGETPYLVACAATVAPDRFLVVHHLKATDKPCPAECPAHTTICFNRGSASLITPHDDSAYGTISCCCI